MRDWLRRQATLQNILMVLVLVSTLGRTLGTWILGVTGAAETTAREIAANTKAITDLLTEQQVTIARVQALELDEATLNDTVAKEFPRRSELEPRLRAIEAAVTEQNMMMRRFMETYRAPAYRER